MGARVGWVRLWAFWTPALMSAVIWLAVWVLALAAFLVVVGVVVVAVLVREQPAVLAGWYGVRRADPAETAAVLAAVVAVQGLRGRGQPRVWVFRRPVAGQVVALTLRDLAVAEGFLVSIMRGGIDVEESSAVAAFALGRRRVTSGAGWVVLQLVCVPWQLAAAAVDGLVQLKVPLTGLLWQLRPVVFVISIVQSAGDGRTGPAVGLVVVLALTYLQPRWQRRWQAVVQEAGDREVIAAGLGRVYARMVRRCFNDAAAEARVRRLTSAP